MFKEVLSFFYPNFDQLYHIIPMKKAFLLSLLFITGFLNAQKVYFIYLQTDNQQPFYARLGEKIYNSSSSGYLILSNLRDSVYAMNIGMQGSQAPDQSYLITVNKRDQGFLLKNFGEKGWGLFNLTSMAVIMAASNPVTTIQTVKTEKREDNDFTNLLAKAADDSTIKQKPIIEKAEEKKVEPTVVVTEKKEEIKETIPPTSEEIKKEIITEVKNDVPKIDSMAIQKQIEETNIEAKRKSDSILAAKNRELELQNQEEMRKQDSINKTKDDIKTEAEYKKSTVKLKSESSTTTGIGLIFLDFLTDQVDTIKILIPPDHKKIASIETKQEEKKFLDMISVDSSKKDEPNSGLIKSNNCKAMATDDDFFKLRKKMAAESTDDNMIIEATKVFKTKCFTVIQIKNLSALFLTDEYKYKFFDASYQYVTDSEKFPSLQSELKDEYYINRFKAMLRI